MKKVSVLLVIGMLTMAALAGAAWPQEKKASPAEAKELLKKAVAYTKAQGCEKALPELSSNKGIFGGYANAATSALDSTGVMLASADQPAMVGKNIKKLKDVEGKRFVEELLESCANRTGCEPVEFQWLSRSLRKVQTRSLLCESVNCSKKDKMNVCVFYEGALK